MLWPLYTGRQTYAKLTQAYAAGKVAYAAVFCLELLTRVVRQGFFATRSEEVSFEATLFIVPELASFPFMLAFCGLIYFHFGFLSLRFLFFLAFCCFVFFHFGLLCLPQKCLVCVWFVLLRGQCLLPSYLPKRGGPMAGAFSCLRETYAALTRGEPVTRNCKATESRRNPNI